MPPLLSPSVSRPMPSICLPSSPRLPLCGLSACLYPPPPSVSIFPNYLFQKRKNPCSLLPAASASTPVPRTPSVPKKLHLCLLAFTRIELDQLAVLSRPPTSHLAFYERPRPRAAALDHRILRCTIEQKRAEILSQITPSSSPRYPGQPRSVLPYRCLPPTTPALPSPKFHRCTGPGTSWGRQQSTFGTEDPEFIKGPDIPSPPFLFMLLIVWLLASFLNFLFPTPPSSSQGRQSASSLTFRLCVATEGRNTPLTRQ